MVFRTKDAAELDDIASSVAGEIDRPTFDRVYGAAIGDGTAIRSYWSTLPGGPRMQGGGASLRSGLCPEALGTLLSQTLLGRAGGDERDAAGRQAAAQGGAR
eukprot:5004447-Prymnesium_polylepis.1